MARPVSKPGTPRCSVEAAALGISRLAIPDSPQRLGRVRESPKWRKTPKPRAARSGSGWSRSARARSARTLGPRTLRGSAKRPGVSCTMSSAFGHRAENAVRRRRRAVLRRWRTGARRGKAGALRTRADQGPRRAGRVARVPDDQLNSAGPSNCGDLQAVRLCSRLRIPRSRSGSSDQRWCRSASRARTGPTGCPR